MSTVLIEIRRAKASDAAAVADAHDEAWRTAYQGIIPGAELRRLINRRGPAWWESAIRKGSRIALLQFGDKIAGYANYGRNRARSLYYDGEIYELYLRPEYQGLGFGRRLFTAARRDLAQRAPIADRLGAIGKRKRGQVLSRARRLSRWRGLRKNSACAFSTRSRSAGLDQMTTRSQTMVGHH